MTIVPKYVQASFHSLWYQSLLKHISYWHLHLFPFSKKLILRNHSRQHIVLGSVLTPFLSEIRIEEVSPYSSQNYVNYTKALSCM